MGIRWSIPYQLVQDFFHQQHVYLPFFKWYILLLPVSTEGHELHTFIMFVVYYMDKINLCHERWSCSNWWFQPIWKNIRQIGPFPQFSGWTPNIYELPPPSVVTHFLLIGLIFHQCPQCKTGSSQVSRPGVTVHRWHQLLSIGSNGCFYIYIYIYLYCDNVYVCMHACMHDVCMYVCMYVCKD